MHLAKVFFVIALFTNFADAVRYVLAGSYRGLHNATTPMVIGIVGLWLGSLPLSYLMGFVFHWGAIGVRLGMGLGIICTTIFLLIKFFFLDRERTIG